MSIVGSVDSVSRDLRYALRGMRRRLGFTCAAVLTLSLGIGATTAIFSVVYSVLIKPLPYPDADGLVRIRHPAPGLNVSDLWADATMYLTYRDENRTFASIGLWQETDATLSGFGESEQVSALRVTHGTLQALRVQPMRGRLFTEQEHGPAAEGPEPVILSYAFWQRTFAGDEAAVGRELSIGSRPAQVVGVMPPDFRFLDMTPQPDVILAVRLDPAQQVHGVYQYQMLGRLKSGVKLAEASADLVRVSPIWLNAWPVFPGLTREGMALWRITPTVQSLKDDLVGDVGRMLWVLMGAVGAVLLIACANIANLMLVRADERRQEFAVRSALGAVPSRIAKELLVESLCVGIAGGLLGLALAYGGLHVLVAVAPSDLPRLHEIAVYPPALAVAIALSLLSALVFGSVTALRHALHIDTPMIRAARGSSIGRERSTMRSASIVVQVALALVLIVSAALMVRTFQALREVDPGFSDAATIQTARIWIPTALFPDAEQYTRTEHEIADRMAAIPGVTSVGFTSAVPLAWPGSNSAIEIDGQTPVAEKSPPLRRFKFVSPGYFEAMGTRMIAGREMAWSDLDAGGAVAVISEDFARELAAEPAGALGKRIRIYGQAEDAWREVIGVVQSVHEDGLYRPSPILVYWPVLTRNMFNSPMVGTPAVTFAVRSARAGTASLTEELRRAIRGVSASIPVAQERTMQSLYAGALGRTSFTLVMLALAGAMALALGVIGIYGVIAYVVAQRAREIGIRLALGAQPRQVAKMFLLQGLALTAVGAVVGLVAAVALARLMSSLLFGIGPMDPLAYLVALGATIAAAALATYLPARRAAAIDPMETLKTE